MLRRPAAVVAGAEVSSSPRPAEAGSAMQEVTGERAAAIAAPARRATDRAQRLGLLLLFALAAALRLHGAWVAQPLSGYDGPFHATNIGILLFEGRIPLPHEGWSTFHPPLYYAISALLWALLPDDLSPHSVLFALRLLNVLASLSLGWAVFVAARIALPARPVAALCAAAVALFLPMEIGPSFLIGNEMFGASLSAWGVAGMLACLRSDATRVRLASLGLVLGMGLITKFNTGVVALSAGLAILVQDVRRRGLVPGALSRAAVLAGLAALIAGWYFAWNLQLYGRPILMQNQIVSAFMAKSGYGPTRPVADYFSLHPGILRIDLDTLLFDDPRSGARAAVWPVTFASVWFDLHSTLMVAPSPPARVAAWILYACGALWTVLALWGAAHLLRQPRGSPPFVYGAALSLVIGLTLASYVVFTWRVATFSALKGSYLSPSMLPFCVLAGAGCDRLVAGGRRIARAALAVLVGVYVATAMAIFWVGWLAPLPFNPGTFYLRAFSDASTRRVTDFFMPPDPIGDALVRPRPR
jgi:hypothetical protein